MARTPLFRALIMALQEARKQTLSSQNRPQPIAKPAGWTRRHFLKSAAASGLLVGAERWLGAPAWAAHRGGHSPEVAVIGAGLAGLNVAYQLSKVGIQASVYEARNRVGGRVHSVVGPLGDEVVIDIGAELINTDHADMLALAEVFGIPLFNRPADAATLACPAVRYFFDGKEYLESELATDLFLLADQIAGDAALIDLDWERYAAGFDRLSVSDYLDRHTDKIPRPYVRVLIEDAIRTEYGVEPQESSALQLLFVLPSINGEAVDLLSYSDETYSVVGGSAQIAKAMAGALGHQVQLNKALRALEREHGRYVLKFEDSSEAIADIVVVALPFPVLSRLTLEAPLPRSFKRFIVEAQLGANEKVLAGFSRKAWRDASGFGSAAWSDLGFAEVWEPSQRQPELDASALNFFLGGEQARRMSAGKDFPKLAENWIKALDPHVPGLQAAATGKVIRSAWTKSPRSMGAYANFAPGQLTRYGSYLWTESDNPAERQTVVFGNLAFVGEHLSDAYYGFMNGAVQTGRLAAAWVQEKVGTARQV